jgi:hypothetical protein
VVVVVVEVVLVVEVDVVEVVVVLVLVVVVVGAGQVVVVVVLVVDVVDVVVDVVVVEVVLVVVVVVGKAHATLKYIGSVQIPKGTTLIVVVKSGTVTARPGANKAPIDIFDKRGLVYPSASEYKSNGPQPGVTLLSITVATNDIYIFNLKY